MKKRWAEEEKWEETGFGFSNREEKEKKRKRGFTPWISNNEMSGFTKEKCGKYINFFFSNKKSNINIFIYLQIHTLKKIK